MIKNSNLKQLLEKELLPKMVKNKKLKKFQEKKLYIQLLNKPWKKNLKQQLQQRR